MDLDCVWGGRPTAGTDKIVPIVILLPLGTGTTAQVGLVCLQHLAKTLTLGGAGVALARASLLQVPVFISRGLPSSYERCLASLQGGG